jgi:hypothetical protein
MRERSRYSIDTSAILDLPKLYARHVFANTVWSFIDSLIDDGVLLASVEVRIELDAKEGDAVHEWAKERPALFRETDEAVQRAVRDVLRDHPNLSRANTTKSAADPFVIALARAEGAAVVTQESAANNLNGPKIPDVCRALGIVCIKLQELLSREAPLF